MTESHNYEIKVEKVSSFQFSMQSFKILSYNIDLVIILIVWFHNYYGVSHN